MNTNGVHISDEILQQVVDGRATPEDSSVASRHLAACARCAQMYRNLVLLDRSLRESISLHPPGQLVDTVLLHVRTARRFAATARIAVIASAAFVTVAVLAAVGGIAWLLTAGRASVTPVSPAQKLVADWYGAWGGTAESILGELARYTSTISTSTIFPTAVTLICTIAAVVAIDATIGRKFARRLR